MIFADFAPVPGTYADTVAKAGGFAFLDKLSRENRLLELHDNHLPTFVLVGKTYRSLASATKQVLELCPFSCSAQMRGTRRDNSLILSSSSYTASDIKMLRKLVACLL